MMKIIEFMWKAIRALPSGPLVLWIHPKSFLVKVGWYKSFRKNRPIDRNGRPIPWFTYPALYFLDNRLDGIFRLFEYGSGYSTLWFSKKVKEVVSVENDANWKESLSKSIPSNVELVYKGNPEDFISEIKNHGQFDIVVIDGIERVKCCFACLDNLNSDGIIIWDDSDREDFREAWLFLNSLGFKEIIFNGLKPASFIISQTSILYRHQNIFGI
jgi:hypothetical protein